MKRVLKYLLYALAAVVVIIVGGGYVLPDTAVVQRQTVIDAPPEKVFALAGDLRRFNEWSPWAAIDPAARYSFEGAERGVGQKMAWASDNPQVGSGSQTITVFEENKRVAMTLDFDGMGSAQASIELAPVADGTGVTWGFKTELNGLGERWLGLMFDRWIGADYEKGLANLKTAVESNGS